SENHRPSTGRRKETIPARPAIEPPILEVGNRSSRPRARGALIRFLIVGIEGKTLRPTSPAGTLWLVVPFILLACHAADTANLKNWVERVPARGEPIKPRSFHVLGDLRSLRS